MSIVTVDELIDYMDGFQLTDRQRQHVEAVILPGLVEQLENHLNRPVTPVQVRETLTADREGYIWFSYTPVQKIIRIMRSDGKEVPVATPANTSPVPQDDDVERTVDLSPNYSGDTYRYQIPGHSPYFPTLDPIFFGEPTYIVDYICAFPWDVLNAMKRDILAIAAREVESMWDHTMSLRGGQQEAASRSDDRPKGWTEDELKKWDVYRRRLVVT